MAKQTIGNYKDNGETGLSARTKLNAMFSEIYNIIERSGTSELAKDNFFVGDADGVAVAKSATEVLEVLFNLSGVQDGYTLVWQDGGFVVTEVGGGAVDSVNEKTGAVVLNQDEVLDGENFKQFSVTEQGKLAAMQPPWSPFAIDALSKVDNETILVTGEDWSLMEGRALMVNGTEPNLYIMSAVFDGDNTSLTVVGSTVVPDVFSTLYVGSTEKVLVDEYQYWEDSFYDESTDVMRQWLTNNPIVHNGSPGRVLYVGNRNPNLGTNTNEAEYNCAINGGSYLIESDEVSGDIKMITGEASSSVFINPSENLIKKNDELKIVNTKSSADKDMSAGWMVTVIALY